MVKLGFSCPQCGRPNRANAVEERTVLGCRHCDYVGLLPLGWAEAGAVLRCPLCGGTRLFRRRSVFLPAAAFLLVALAALVAVGLHLPAGIAAAGLPLVCLFGPERLVCYRCRTWIGGHAWSARHPRYDARLDRESGRDPPGSDRERESSDRGGTRGREAPRG